ncbi:FAD-dependent monooxygenase [Salinimonas chungwhensis]|uniref:FAD-dependent monooxygenase n=1 Tax=Salinimonas chungwhensis TaxID=265425 RepID=UPI000367ACC7|nr:FAD-dependent monooxygenase [Salinimonas chungwhensis]
MFDFCVNGGGLIGAATALGLVRQGYTVALLEPQVPDSFEENQPPDLRLSAFSVASTQLLDSLGAWTRIPESRIRAYDRLSVWENNGARTDFDAAMLDTDRLGYFVENRLVQSACLAAIKAHNNGANLTLFSDKPEKIIFNQPHGAHVVLNADITVQCRWVIGADGANSLVRRQAGIGVSGWQYGQQALGIVVKLATPAAGWTWQAFHTSGPRAFLPMYDTYGSFIWYDDPATIKSLSQLDDNALTQRIKKAFPGHAGDFKIVKKAAFPLTRMHAQQYIKHQAVLLGDAAHTINPLAGQGVNIGYKDVKAFLALTDVHRSPQSLSEGLKMSYEPQRRRDNLAMMSAMDGLYWLFSNDNPPLKWLRNQLLSVAQNALPAKRHVLKYAMGIQ